MVFSVWLMPRVLSCLLMFGKSLDPLAEGNMGAYYEDRMVDIKYPMWAKCRVS